MTQEVNSKQATGTAGREPDELLVGVRRSILGLALVLSTVIHVVVIGGSSFSLYRDWAKYGLTSDELGFHTPSDINQIKNREQREADDAARKAAIEKRASEAAARAAQAASNAAPATATAPAAAGDGSAASGTPTVKPPEVEPLAPKTEFTYGEDLQL